MLYGYARKSTEDQKLDIQINQLEAFGCDKVIRETISGIEEEKELNVLISTLKKGDTLVATRMDRLGRSTRQLIELVDELNERDVNLVLLDSQIDTRSATGKAFLTVMAAFSDLERMNLKEKQRRGIANRRKKGLHMGRKPKFEKEQMEEALMQVQTTDKTMKEISKATGVSRSSIYREMKARGITRF